MPGGLPKNMQANAQQFWKMLDDLSESDPQAYKDFIEKQMATAADEKQAQEGKQQQTAKGKANPAPKQPGAVPTKRAEPKQAPSAATFIKESAIMHGEGPSDPPPLVIPHSTPAPSAGGAKPLIQELSSSSSSPASSAPPPSHSLTLEGEGAQRKFVLSARFEEVEEGAAIDVQVSDKKVILLAPGGSKLELGLAEAVREGEVSAKWKKKKKTLIVDLPIARSF